ncbi:hypothetical protein ACFWAT_01785 [Streptomyces syringium]|uniref:hypothetical protein n=1 Tax=Streptomyces syringium TaxID=76729 RepID=UPI0036637614
MSSQSGPDRAAASLTGAFRPAQGAYEARGPIQFEVINLLRGWSVLAVPAEVNSAERVASRPRFRQR